MSLEELLERTKSFPLIETPLIKEADIKQEAGSQCAAFFAFLLFLRLTVLAWSPSPRRLPAPSCRWDASSSPRPVFGAPSAVASEPAAPAWVGPASGSSGRSEDSSAQL